MKQGTATGADWERGERGVVDEGTVFKWQKGMLSIISGKPDQDVRKKQISDLGERRVTEIFFNSHDVLLESDQGRSCRAK